MGSAAADDQTPRYEGRPLPRPRRGARRPGAGLRRRHPAEPPADAAASSASARPTVGLAACGGGVEQLVRVVRRVVVDVGGRGRPARSPTRPPAPTRATAPTARTCSSRAASSAATSAPASATSSGTAEGVPMTLELDRHRPRQRRRAVRGRGRLRLALRPRGPLLAVLRRRRRTRTTCAACRSPTPTGRVRFTSIFPACYAGRWPHIHFEVYPDEAGITDSAQRHRHLAGRAAAGRLRGGLRGRPATRRRSQPVRRSAWPATTSSATTAARASSPP